MPEAKPLLSNLYDVFHKLQSVIIWLLTSSPSHYGLSVRPIAVGLGHVTCVAHWRLAGVLWAEALNICMWFSFAHVSGNSLVGCYLLRLGPQRITYGTYLNPT